MTEEVKKSSGETSNPIGALITPEVKGKIAVLPINGAQLVVIPTDMSAYLIERTVGLFGPGPRKITPVHLTEEEKERLFRKIAEAAGIAVL